MAVDGSQTVVVDGRPVRLTNLDKVLYPETGTTKAEVISYYAQVAEVMLPLLWQRPVTRKRWPDGVGATAASQVFFAKDLPKGTPEWIRRYAIQHSTRANEYPVVDDLATLTWLAQLAALELHVPQWRFDADGSPLRPDRLVLDLDPGEGVTLAECAEVAGWVREVLAGLGHEPVPVTSGSKGIHLYAPLDGSLTSAEASELARQLALGLQAEHADRVTATMERVARPGKVFLDWSQNNGAKTTISPYSLRGRERPWVAAPRTWAELADPDLRQLEHHEVVERIATLGDPMAHFAGPPDRLTKYRSMRDPAKTPEPDLSAEPPAGDGFPQPVHPMLATLATASGLGDERDWAFEMKWDGVRIIAYLAGGRVKLLSRRGRDDTAAYAELIEPLAGLECAQAVLDGEIVVTDAAGVPRFSLLQPRINLTRPAEIAAAAARYPVQLMLFDLLRLDGRSLIRQPYEERRRLLEALVGSRPGSHVQAPPVFEGDLAAALQTSLSLDLEGVVAKRRDSIYQPGQRAHTWLKIKHRRTQAVVVGGWRPGKGNRAGGIGSLLLAIPGPDGLRYAGRAGSGFTTRGLAEAGRKLASLARPENPLLDVPAEDARDAHWVEPTLVGEVHYSGVTDSGRLWHPVWRGWRPDLEPGDVTWEIPT